MAYEIHINPIDLDTDLAVGILLNTSHENGKLFKQSYTSLEQSSTNLLNLLLTNEGERMMQPEFGCSLNKLLFDNISSDLVNKLDNKIRTKINYWMPYLDIVRLDILIRPDEHFVHFDLEFALQGNKFDTGTITFKLDLQA